MLFVVVVCCLWFVARCLLFIVRCSLLVVGCLFLVCSVLLVFIYDLFFGDVVVCCLLLVVLLSVDGAVVSLWSLIGACCLLAVHRSCRCACFVVVC